jgi:hypothetical protein
LGERVEWIQDQLIRDVFQASADFCKKLASRAFEKEQLPKTVAPELEQSLSSSKAREAATAQETDRPIMNASSGWNGHQEKLIELVGGTPSIPGGKGRPEAQVAVVPVMTQRTSRFSEAPEVSHEPAVRDWGEVEIRFLSDERVQITVGKQRETRNYAEFGFEDGRSKRPNLAWITLRVLAKQQGTISSSNAGGWGKVEKRMQEIRRVLRHHFVITDDPLPFIEGIGYRTRFKIGCAPSCDS